MVQLDLSLPRSAWRALHRSRERADFWWWLLTYRRRWRPMVLGAVRRHAPDAALYVLRSPRAVERCVDRGRG